MIASRGGLDGEVSADGRATGAVNRRPSRSKTGKEVTEWLSSSQRLSKTCAAWYLR
jgi:hypothetical protein